jgi:hypothetical protein
MLSIDSEDVLDDPLSFGFNTTKQVSLFLHIFDFHGPSVCQTHLKLLPCHFFRISRIREEDKRCNEVGVMGVIAYHTGQEADCVVGPTSLCILSTQS